MILCRGCQSGGVKELLNIGVHPVSNCFLKHPSVVDPRYLLAMGQCEGCGLVQLTELMPANVLVPIYGWITYNDRKNIYSLCQRFFFSLVSFRVGS